MQIRINNSFVSSFREAIYKLKCRNEACNYLVAYWHINFFKELTVNNIVSLLASFLFLMNIAKLDTLLGEGQVCFIVSGRF